MGKCNFGYISTGNGKMFPMISINQSDGTSFEFICRSISFEQNDTEQANAFINAIFDTLTGEQDNLVKDPKGNLKP